MIWERIDWGKEGTGKEKVEALESEEHRGG